MRNVILLPDENFYLTLIKNNIDPLLLDHIEKDAGTIILNENINDKLTIYIARRRSVIVREILKATIDRYTNNYTNITNEISKSKNIPLNVINNNISELNNIIKQKINIYNKDIQDEDIELISLSYYIRSVTNYEPIIVSDDKHILIYGNLLSSFYGLNLSYLSIYELLKICQQDIYITKYLSYKNLTELKNYSLTDKINKKELQDAVYAFLKCNLLAVHPKPNSEKITKFFIRY